MTLDYILNIKLIEVTVILSVIEIHFVDISLEFYFACFGTSSPGSGYLKEEV